MFATSHLWCSLPWWIHCPLACSVAKESQRTFHLCGERFSFVDWTTKSSFIRRSANFGNVSPFSSTSRGNKHIFRAYPSTLKIAELCFETKAANSIIIWSARLGFLPLREAGTGFVGVLTHPSTHFWSSRKHYIVHGNNAQDCFRYSWLFWVRLHIFRNFSWIIALWHGVRKKKRKKTNCKTFCLKRLETGTTCINKGVYYRTSPVHGNILNFHSR